MGAAARDTVHTALRGMDLFGALDDRALDGVVALGDVRTAGSEQAIFEQGDPGDRFFVVIEGSVRIVLHLPNGTPKELARLGEGSFFGEMGPISDKPRGADAIACEPTVLFELRKVAFLRMLDEQPMVSMRLRAIMARRGSENLSASLAPEPED